MSSKYQNSFHTHANVSSLAADKGLLQEIFSSDELLTLGLNSNGSCEDSEKIRKDTYRMH